MKRYLPLAAKCILLVIVVVWGYLRWHDGRINLIGGIVVLALLIALPRYIGYALEKPGP